MEYIHHFDHQAANYLQFRPNYPLKLFELLVNVVKAHDLVWDCGTGSGQAAVALARNFKQVIATDINQAPLDQAPKKENIRYQCTAVEKTNIQSGSVDLITVAQALHWFDFNKFYSEVKRVAKPEGIIAAWCYSLGSLNPQIDNLINKLYAEILSWPTERRYIDEKYQTIPFPFEKIPVPTLSIDKQINFSELISYISTWSAVKEYQKQHQQNPIALVHQQLQEAWGNTQEKRMISWPLHLLIGKINSPG